MGLLLPRGVPGPAVVVVDGAGACGGTAAAAAAGVEDADDDDALPLLKRLEKNEGISTRREDFFLSLFFFFPFPRQGVYLKDDLWPSALYTYNMFFSFIINQKRLFRENE
jgi:hypothetical protein